MFNSENFQSEYIRSIAALRGSENVTRSELRALSISTLVALHTEDNPLNGDVRFINELISVLTPINKKAACLYFRAFTGFKYDGVAMQFTGKNKKVYDDSKKLSDDFLNDPLNNIWTWAERNIEVEAKAFDLKKAVDTVFKRATKGLDGEALNVMHLQIIKEVFAQGVSVDTMIEFMETICDIKEG